MLKLVLGRAGSGKTTHVRSEFVSLARNGGTGMIMIVPEQFSFECERAFLRELSAKDAQSIEVLSFRRLADRLISESGEKRSFIDKGKQAVAMSIALENINDELQICKDKSDSLDFIRAMASFCSELRRSCISPQLLSDISCKVNGEALRKKLSDISLISLAYEAVMEDVFYDSEDKLEILKALISQTEYFKGKKVVLDAFKGFTEQEFKIIELILRQASEVTVTLCMDAPCGDDEPYSLFYCTGKTYKRLIRAAKAAGAEIMKPTVLNGSVRFKNAELKFLEENLFRVGAGRYDGKCENVSIYAAGDVYEESDRVASRIMSLLRDENYRAREIAVIYRDDSYAPILRSALRRFGAPVFDDARQPYSAMPLIVFIKHAFSAVRCGFDSNEILKFLKSGLSGMSIGEISLLENYVYVWQINGKKWFEEWTGNPRGYESFRDSDKEELKKLNALRQRVTAPLERFGKSCHNASAKELSTAVFMLLKEMNVRESLRKLALSFKDRAEYALSLEQEQTWGFVMKTLNDMTEILGDKRLSVQKYEQLFWFIVNCADLGKLPSGLDEVELGNADRVRTVNPRAVFIVGLNDGKFPRTQERSGILSSREISELQNSGFDFAEDDEYLLSQERFLLYSSLCCSSERVFLSYSESSVGGDALAPSSAVLQVKSMLSLSAEKSGDASELDSACSAETLFSLLSKKYGENDAETAALLRYFSEREDYAGRLRALKRVRENEGFKFADSSVSKKLFGENMYISASKADDFYKCRFKYFCRFGLGVQGLRAASLDFMKSGLVVHYVMENILKKYGKEGLLKASSDEIKEDVRLFMDNYLDEAMGGKEDKTKRFMYLFERLRVIITSVIAKTVEEFSQSEFSFVDFELKIDRDGDISPLILPLPSGGSVCVHGSVDRVDMLQKDGASYIRVVDYKTGRKDFRLSDILYGLNMQMLIYLDCICKNGEERYGKVLPAGVLYMPSKREFTESGGKSKLKMQGLLVDDADILTAMEKELKGVFIPASRRSEKISGSLISAERMGKLTKKIEKMLTEMGEMLHKGDIDCVPFYESEDSNACTYCEYKSVCLSNGSKKRKFESFKNEEIFTMLDGEAQTDGQ